MSLISVIIPVYKVEEYLDRCVESVVNQTYENLEIILVDDGSPDNCPAMCDVWAEKDIRIKVIHKKNGGLSDARNFGIDASTGDYLIFIDSDDYISYDCIEKLFNALCENQCDMSVGRFVQVCDGAEEVCEFTDKLYIYSKDEFWNLVYSLMLEGEFNVSVNMIISCNKLIKRKAFDKIRFPVGKLHEDEFIIHKLVSECSKIAFVDTKLYYYVRRGGSITESQDLCIQLDFLEAITQREDYFIDAQVPFLSLSLSYLLGYLCWFYFEIKNQDINAAKNVRKYYRNYYRKSLKSNIKKEPHYRKKRLLYFSFYINEYLFRIIRKIARILNIIN